MFDVDGEGFVSMSHIRWGHHDGVMSNDVTTNQAPAERREWGRGPDQGPVWPPPGQHRDQRGRDGQDSRPRHPHTAEIKSSELISIHVYTYIISRLYAELWRVVPALKRHHANREYNSNLAKKYFFWSRTSAWTPPWQQISFCAKIISGVSFSRSM